MEKQEPQGASEKESKPEINDLVKSIKENPVFKDIPEEQIESFAIKCIEYYQEEQNFSYEGMLPPPVIMEGYEKFYPGVTKVIIDSYIEESTHRRGLEKEMVKCETNNTSKGMNYALIVVGITVIGACVSAFLGSTVIGSIIGVGGLATLAYTFIQGRKSK